LKAEKTLTTENTEGTETDEISNQKISGMGRDSKPFQIRFCKPVLNSVTSVFSVVSFYSLRFQSFDL